MEYYRNLGGNSGVFAFEIGNNNIKVQFRGGTIYLYSYIIPGSFEVEKMKNLAVAGQGLNSYISTYIKKRYASRLR